MRRVRILSVAFAAWLAPWGVGYAQPKSEAALEVGTFYGDDGTAGLRFARWALSPRARFRHDVSPDVRLGATFGLIYHAVDVEVGPIAGDDNRFCAGNPVLGALVRVGSGRTVVRLGGLLGLPLAQSGCMGAYGTWGLASAMRGYWNVWEWFPEAFTPGFDFLVETTSDELVFGAEGAAALLFAVDDAFDDDVELGLQAGGFAAWQGSLVRVGAALRFVWLPTIDGDFFQMSLEPLLRIGRRGFFETRLTVNLDNPAGFSFDDGGVWGWHLGGGGQF